MMAAAMDLDEAFCFTDELGSVDELNILQTQLDIIEGKELVLQSQAFDKQWKNEAQDLKEQQDIQSGQIKMLRAELALRSKELDQERLERDRILEDRLQQQRDKEIQLQRNIERLRSELSFRDQEVRCSNSKVHTLEQKLKQKLPNGSVPNKHKSPDKLANASLSFHEKPKLSSKNTQTDNGKNISFQRTAALIDVANTPADVSHVLYYAAVPAIRAPDVRTSFVTARTQDKRMLSQAGQTSDITFQKQIREAIPTINKTMNLTNALHLNCYCSVEPENRFPEVGILLKIQEQVKDYMTVVAKLCGVKDTTLRCSETGHCNKCSKAIYSQSLSNSESLPREVFFNTQMLMISAMKELADLISVSIAAGKMLLEKWKEATQSEKELFSEKKLSSVKETEVSLLWLLLSTSVPLFSSGELLNGAVIEWVLTILHSLATYSCLCCLKYFDRILQGLCLNVLLDGTCGDEIAFQALKFLCRCIPSTFVEPFLGHHSDPCILGSIAKFYGCVSSAAELTDRQHQCYIPSILDFLTALIVNHGHTVVSVGSGCVCFSELLEAIILCLLLICRKSDNLFVFQKGLHFLHLISKTFPTFRNLRSRVGDEYVMLICEASILCKTDLKSMLEVVNDLWDFGQDDSKEFDKDEAKAMDID